MTVNYNLCVSTSSPVSLLCLLCRWKGSIWKAILVEFTVWLAMYIAISAVINSLLGDNEQTRFYDFAKWLDERMKYIPLDFMLGFFVSIVITRWNKLFSNIGVIERLALAVSGTVHGTSDSDRLARRNIIRYCCLGQVLAFRNISVQVRNRFPTLDTIIASAMTVNYNLCVSTSSPVSLLCLLCRWKGSIWKAILVEFTVWLAMYIAISAVINSQLLGQNEQTRFYEFAKWLDERMKYIPLDFMLGFFVSIVITRWNKLFSNIGVIERLALAVSGTVHGTSDSDRLARRNIIRYCCLGQVLAFRNISVQVRNRFPTLDTIIASGFMMEHERKKFEALEFEYGKSWMPFQWAISLLKKARDDGRITSDPLYAEVMREVRDFRSNLNVLINSDWVPIPIMYPQLVCLAVHVYFVVALFSHQPVYSHNNNAGISVFHYVMASLQFIFYMGWLKVAEALLNPMGEDDDDFECNFLIDRNLSMGLTIVDGAYNDPPEEIKDKFWDQNVSLLYTEASAHRQCNPLIGSVADMELPENVDQVTMIPMKNERKSIKQRRRVSVDVKNGNDNIYENGSSKTHHGPAYANSIDIADETERHSFGRAMSNEPTTNNLKVPITIEEVEEDKV